MLGPHLHSFGHPSLGRFFASAVLTFALQSPSSLTWSASVPGLLAFALFFLFGGIGGLSPSTYCRTAPTPSRQRGSGDAEDVLPCGVRGGGGPRQRQQKADAARRKPEHQKQEREQPVDEKRTRIARERRRTLRERVPE